MYKIVVAINSMIENESLITNVSQSHTGGELFFLYDGQFKWSISKGRSDNYMIRYYPGTESLQNLIDWELNPETYSYASVTYSTQEMKTREAVESFADLYRTVQNKVYDVESVLDQIIQTAA